jgi:tetratricopeptide (TPR) repeat protein
MREVWLALEADVGDKVFAFNERKKMYLANPKDRENCQAYAALLGETTPVAAMITDNAIKPLYTEQRWDRMSVDEKAQIVEQVRKDWQKQADDILNALMSEDKDALRLASLKARLLRARNDVTGGENVLRDYIEAHKPNVTCEMILELARYQEASNHFSEAIQNYTEAIGLQDATERQANFALGSLYQRLNMHAKAYEQLTKVVETNPSVELEQQIIECLVKMKNFDDAERRLKSLASSNSAAASSNISAMLSATIAEGRADDLYTKGQTAEAERKFVEQREYLVKAESLDPNTPLPRQLIAQSFFNEFKRSEKPALLDDALAALERADKVSPGNRQTSMLRQEILRSKGDLRGCIAELRRILQRSPDDPVARRQIVQAYIDAGDFQTAFDTVNEAISVNPTLGYWHETLGDLYHAFKNDAQSAYKSYARAYDLVPTPMMLGKLLDCGMAMTPPDNAGAVDRLSKHASDMDSTPPLRLVYARALAGLNRRDEAMTEYRKAYTQYREKIASGAMPAAQINDCMAVLRVFFAITEMPALEQFFMETCSNKADCYELRILAQMWAQTGASGLTHAKELLTQAIEKCPADQKDLRSRMYVDLSNYNLFTNDMESAVAAMVEALKLDPNNVDALNNLAFIYADLMNQPDKAMPLVDRVLALRPRDPSVLDTAGWVNFKAGNDDKAKDYLRQSLKLLDENGIAHVHLAYVYFKLNDRPGAQEHLKRAMDLRPDPDTKAKIDQLVQQMNKTK